MDSLTEKDFKVWANRTQKYLSEFNSNAGMVGVVPVLPELKKLKIIRIDEDTNWVGYVWMGGMDHTELFVERSSDGSFKFTARYNDAEQRILKIIRPDVTETNPP